MIFSLQKYYDRISIFHIILILFSIHMFLISKPNFEILDELFFTNFMRWFMVGIDHTPYQLNGLSVIVAPFVYFFGDNWFSWRFPIIIFGMVFLYFNYKVIEHISNKKIALLSSCILSLSPLIFVHSSLMLRDIPVMALGFMGLYLYLKQRYYFSMLVIGLSALIKETAIFFVFFIIIHYTITNRNDILILVSSSIEKTCSKFGKTPLVMLVILSLSFLVPLTIYDNTVTVFEYTTQEPEYLIQDEQGKLKVKVFRADVTSDELLEKSIDEFNYMSIVKNPIHHLSLWSGKGYLGIQNPSGGGEFVLSFLPMGLSEFMYAVNNDGWYEVDLNKNNMEIHKFEFHTFWVSSMINYSWWYVGFYSCIGLMVFGVFQRFKNKITIPKNTVFIFCGFAFFIPYLFVTLLRDTYAYYMIYFLPIMAFGLTSVIYKISNKTLRFIIFGGLFLAIIFNFLYVFPIWGF